MSIESNSADPPLTNIDLSLPDGWGVEAQNTIPTAETDVLLTGPSVGETLSIKVKPGNRVWVTYNPRGYDKTRVTNPTHTRYFTNLDDAIETVRDFFSGASGATAFDSKQTA